MRAHAGPGEAVADPGSCSAAPAPKPVRTASEAASKGARRRRGCAQLQCRVVALALGLLPLVAGQAPADCAAALRALGSTADRPLSTLQPCVTTPPSPSLPLVLDSSGRPFSAPSGQRQTLDLAFLASAVLLILPGVTVDVSAADLTSVRVATPATSPFRVLAITVQPTAALALRDVRLETDCVTLSVYQLWVLAQRPANLSLSAEGDVQIGYWQQAGLTVYDSVLSCRRPPAVTSPDRTATTVSVATDLDFYNALALAPSYAGDVTLSISSSGFAMVSPLWLAQGVVLQRSVTVVSANASRKPILDLQDMTGPLHVGANATLTFKGVAFSNVGMVNGYAPVPFTGLGLVTMFLWFIDVPRSLLSSRGPNQLIVSDCEIIVWQEEVDHLLLWATFVTTTTGPIAAAAVSFRIGIREIQVDPEATTKLMFDRLDAYGMDFVATSLVPAPLLGYNLTSRRTYVPLWQLYTPINTTIVPVWSQQDLQGAMAGVQRLSACSPYSNVTVHFQVFANLSLDATKWPAAGFNSSCNISISGTPGLPGGTWLNFNLLPRFISVSNRSMLIIKSFALFNMPSQQRTYSLDDLTQMTMPLWPIGRAGGGGGGSPAGFILQDCTLVLPAEEFRSAAAVMGFPGGRVPSRPLNTSISLFEIQPGSAGNRLELARFEGLNMTASRLVLTDTTTYAPYSALLGSNIYGVAESPPPPPGDAGAAPASSGLTSSAIVAIAIAVPVGCLVLVTLLLLALLYHHRRHAKPPTSPPSSGEHARGTSSPGTDESPAFRDGVSAGEKDGWDATAVKASECDSELRDPEPVAPPLHVELHQLILDFAREIEDKHLTIDGPVGSGGFATVYRGSWRGIDVAVKVIEFQDRTTTGDEKLRTRAMTETAIAANIQHANIVTTYSYDIRPVQPNEPDGAEGRPSTLLGIGPSPEGAAAGQQQPRRSSGSEQSGGSAATQAQMWKLYLIQEFCEVGSLRQAMESRLLMGADGLANLPLILRLALDVVRGLQHLHKKNIVHGDLTPGNILLRANLNRPSGFVAKLADFGLSVKMNPAQTSVDNNRTGTPFYASPEVRQHGNLTKASDLYALGVVLWEMWHCRPCYQRVRGVKHYIHATGYPSFPSACPPAYAALATRCMRRALDERPQLGEVHEVLNGLLTLATGAASMQRDSLAGSDGGTSGVPSSEWPTPQGATVQDNAAYGFATGTTAGDSGHSARAPVQAYAPVAADGALGPYNAVLGPGVNGAAGHAPGANGGGVAAAGTAAASPADVTAAEWAMAAAAAVAAAGGAAAPAGGSGASSHGGHGAAPGGSSWRPAARYPTEAQGPSRLQQQVLGNRQVAAVPQPAPPYLQQQQQQQQGTPAAGIPLQPIMVTAAAALLPAATHPAIQAGSPAASAAGRGEEARMYQWPPGPPHSPGAAASAVGAPRVPHQQQHGRPAQDVPQQHAQHVRPSPGSPGAVQEASITFEMATADAFFSASHSATSASRDNPPQPQAR